MKTDLLYGTECHTEDELRHRLKGRPPTRFVVYKRQLDKIEELFPKQASSWPYFSQVLGQVRSQVLGDDYEV